MYCFSLFLRRFPDCEDVILNALKLTNQARYNKALNGLVNEKVNVSKMLTQPQPESFIQKTCNVTHIFKCLKCKM